MPNQGYQEVLRVFMGVTRGIKRYQEASRGIKRYQEVPRGIKRYQEVSKGIKCIKGCQEYQGHQKYDRLY